MIAKSFIGYVEGQDLTLISQQYLAFPSKNVLIHKGIAYTRPGIKNDGNAPTEGSTNKIIGERVWKDALGGEKPLRVVKGGTLQLKWNGVWIPIYTGITSTAIRVRFDTWIDDSGDIIKKRIFFVDGTDAIYEWGGAVATIATVDSPGHSLTFSEDSTGLKLGFDDGSGTPSDVQIVRFSAGVAQAPDVYQTDSDMSTQTIHLTSGYAHVPVAGDLVMSAVIKHTDKLSGIDKDDIYTYKNHIGVANLESITVYFSNAETKLDYVIPAAADRTALSPFLVNLDQNYTAMISRYDASLKETVLWISSVDDWIKIDALDAADSNGEWVSVQQVQEAERTGALPFCVAQQKGDIIFFAQDRTMQRIETVDVLAKDTLTLMSDEVESLLERLDATECRIYYLKRYIYLVFPAESTVVVLDIVEGHFMPPWTLPVQLMSVIDGVLYGHSNSRDETFYMNKGTDDLGSQIESKFAFPYYEGAQRSASGQVLSADFMRKQHNKFGVSCRLNSPAKATVEEFFETDGAEATETWVIDGATVTTYSVADDEGWATHIWGSASYGGADDPANPLRRCLAFRAYDALSWFEFRPVITVNGKDQQFQLLGWYIDESLSDVVIPDALYIER